MTFLPVDRMPGTVTVQRQYENTWRESYGAAAASVRQWSLMSLAQAGIDYNDDLADGCGVARERPSVKASMILIRMS
jgi:hypothetical protein